MKLYISRNDTAKPEFVREKFTPKRMNCLLWSELENFIYNGSVVKTKIKDFYNELISMVLGG